MRTKTRTRTPELMRKGGPMKDRKKAERRGTTRKPIKGEDHEQIRPSTDTGER